MTTEERAAGRIEPKSKQRVTNQIDVLRAQARYFRGEAEARDELAEELLAELRAR